MLADHSNLTCQPSALIYKTEEISLEAKRADSFATDAQCH